MTIAQQTNFQEAGIRTEPLPSAAMDSAGKAYVAWQDCSFESGCSANDMVMSTSTDGTTWSAAQLIPADAVGSGVDHFIPGLAVDPTTSGSSAHLALAYYFYPNAACSASTCQLEVGFVSSVNGGSAWSSASTLTASAMNLTWLANTTDGFMGSDYISTSFAGGHAYPVFVTATAPTGSQLNESLNTVQAGLSVTGGAVAASSQLARFAQVTPVRLYTAF